MIRALGVFFLASCFYMYDYILQVAPSVMAKPIMQTFNVTSAGFGTIAAFYFYAYAPMQIPAGLLYDRYGPRRVMTAAIFVCALGTLFFAVTDSVITASLGRFLIGAGSAFSFVGILILISRWFPARYFALLAGIAQMMSSVGAVFGQAPFASLVAMTSWRQASLILALLGFGLMGLFWLFIRDYPHQQTQSNPKNNLLDEWRRLQQVCRNKHTWCTAGFAFSIWTPIAVFAALWGVSFLETKYQISVVAASAMCSLIWIGIAVGSPLLGWLSDYFHARRLIMILSSLLGLMASLFILYAPNVTQASMSMWLFLLGFASSVQIVSFSLVKEQNPENLVGSASGFNNMAILLGGALFQPMVGFIIHHSRSIALANQIPSYPLSAYQSALVIIPLCYILSCLIGLLLIKKS